jgi:tetratricopeptide (TPR) repeat protein
MVGALPPSLRPVAKAPPPGPRPGPLSPAAQASAATLAERETALQAAGAAPAWLQLARDADRLGAPAVAERAARRASGPAAAALVSDARRARREVALPLEGLVPVAREPEYVRTVNQVLTLVDRRKVSEAGAALRTLAGAFPGSPGLALAECAVAWATGAAQAASSCEAAARLFDEAPRAHLLLGSVHAKSGRWAEARDQFRRALDLDDAVAEPWRRLAGALGKLGQAGPLHDLEARYQAKFGYALRPVGD